MSGNSLETQSQDNSTSLPKDKSSVLGFFSGLGNRYKNAVETAKKGTGFKEKVLLFITSFFSEVQTLSEEEQKIKQETAEKTGRLIMNTPNDQLAASFSKEFLGSSPEPTDSLDKTVLNDFSSSVVVTAKSFPEKEVGSMFNTIDKKDGEKITNQEKMLLASFGIKTLVNLRNNPAYNTIDTFTKALDRFERVTKNGKGLAHMKQKRIKEIFKFGGGDLASFLPLINKIGYDAGFELYRKLSSSVLTGEEAYKLQSKISALFPNTSDDNRAKALMTINGIILGKKMPENKQIAELVFYINPVDLVALAETLKSIK